MSDEQLKKISLDELKPGMYVHSIAEQRGNIQITSRGKVTSSKVIAQMRKKGIVAVVIDPSKAFTPEPEESTLAEAAVPQQDVSKPASGSANVAFEDELRRATVLHGKGKSLQKRILKSLSKGLPIDISVPKEFTKQLVGSIDRNPNALMCMTQIREKDSYLFEHSLNVAVLLANFGRHLGMQQSEILELAYAGFLHDIGKIKIPDEILHKPGRLTEEEMDVMRKHVEFGLDALREMGIPEHIIKTVGEHHERLDGLGYPLGAKEQDITTWGRMIAIVDTYDAITADRCYKPGMPSQRALQILMKDAPVKYDKTLVEQFVRCVGIYPVGTLVKLNNDRLAMVVEQRADMPLKPKVKAFYSTKNNHYIAPTDIDLAQTAGNIKIESAVKSSDYKIDFNRYFEEKISI
ncbi:HD-GYP domain-containing protein [Aestuariibacter salexigens]|uniref:HD-GYP domain-containing protein n=1 Tax=Aestuariibacter salexigens TaxID=226010 RepID=UPI000412C69E|nr:HD-GYP domain-containing protein [Aestuariibacter salexigens]